MKFRHLITGGQAGTGLNESDMKYQALAMAKEVHNNLAQISFIEMLGVMSADNPAKKEVQELEAKINDITNDVGDFIQKYIPDVAAAEAGDTDEMPEDDEPSEPSEPSEQPKKDQKPKEK